MWLHHARFYKTRSLATKAVRAGRMRISGRATSKASAVVKAGDVLTFAYHDRIKVLKVAGFAQKRGPASEAQALYEDLSPPAPERGPISVRKGPRPTKRDRRTLDAWQALQQD